jgi:putative ABC transport system permease protein
MTTSSPPRPPRLGYALLSLLLKRGEHWGLIGDFDEVYAERVAEKGRAAARAWYWGQIAKFAPAYIINSFLWSKDMFKNHLTVAWRNIKKSKAYSALNILGLAVGMAVFILIMLYVRYELSYDRYHANAQNIFEVIQENPSNTYLGSKIFALSPAPMAPTLVQDFPEVKAATRIIVSHDVLISIGDKYHPEKRFFWSDPQTFDIFSFPIVRGEKVAFYNEPFSVLLSERESLRLFGGADPLGRTIVYHFGEKRFDFKVAGVFKDIPANSHFDMDIVAPFETLPKITKIDLTRWGANPLHTYVLLKSRADSKALDGKLTAFMEKYAGSKIVSKRRYYLQPLTRIHLHSRANFELFEPGDARLVFLFASIAVLVLIIACVNYINLTTARSLKRAKEVGLRKVVGAAKGQLVRQFLCDSTAMTFLALLLAIGFVHFVLPAFRSFVGREIVLNPFRDIALMPGLILLAAVVGAIAGSYPAFIISSFRPATVLKGTSASRAKGLGLRNALIIIQFAVSIALIICTVGLQSQISFIQGRNMGYERGQIVVLEPQGGLRNNIEAFKTELKRNPNVLAVASSSSLPNNIDSKTLANWPGKLDSVEIPIYDLEADSDFIDLYGLKIVQGRDFSHDNPSDVIGGAVLINESARKTLGWDDPLGREFNHWGINKSTGKIVGIVEDFHMHSLHFPIMPLYIFLDPKSFFYVSVKIRETNIAATLAFVRETWKRFEPNYPFEYSYFNEIFDRDYRKEQRLGTMFRSFAGLAILIACLGLVGLASFTAERKTKEIGIRKVLGASSSGVIILLSREFMKWVVLANVIAWPIGYFAMKSWLRSFAYKTSLTVPMFLGAGLGAFLIAAAVISLQTYKAASANPADSIRYE